MSDRSFIETQFPIAPLSAESYKERKANLGQTLTRLGKWWGRKPLVLVRASVLGLLMPASDDPKKDREIFLKLMTMDPDGLWRRRKGKINDTEILKRAPEYKETWRATPKDERDELREEIWKNLSEEDRAALEENRRFKYTREELQFVAAQAQKLAQTGTVAVLFRDRELEQVLPQLVSGTATRLHRDLKIWPRGPGVFYGTFHAAKGLEFDSVLVPYASSERLPHPPDVAAFGADDAAARNTKLLYVAVTRSKSNLVITHSGAPTSLLPTGAGLLQRRQL